MSNTAAGYNSQNGAGKQSSRNGPIQNPVMMQAPGQSYNTAAQTMHPQHMPAKAPLEQPAGQYHYGCYQSAPPVSVYQGPGQSTPPVSVYQGPGQSAPPVSMYRGPGHSAPPVSTYQGPGQSAPPVSMYQGTGQTSMTRPPTRPLQPHQAGSAGIAAPAQSSTPPPVVSNSFYPGSQIPPHSHWPYGTPPPLNQPPVGSQANHVTSAPSQPSAMQYGIQNSPPQGPPAPLNSSVQPGLPSGYGIQNSPLQGPPAPLNSSVQPGPPSGYGIQNSPPQGPPAPLNSSVQPGPPSGYGIQNSPLQRPPAPLNNSVLPGPAPPPINPPSSQTYQPGRQPFGPPLRPAAPPTGQLNNAATPPPPAAVKQEVPGAERAQIHNSFDALENGGRNAAQHPPQMGRAVGLSYPSLPPGYQNVTAPPCAPGMQPPGQPYPAGAQSFQQGPLGPAQLGHALGGMNLQQSKPPEALRTINLLQERNLLPWGPVTPPVPCLPQDLQRLNCSPEVFRCTLTNIPQTQSLLNKAKLPLGLLLHPFKDMSQLPVVTSSTIVRCRSCRTYINPFVTFLDQRRWKCNLCYRVNEVPEEFMYNPVSRSYGEPHKRPEVQNPTIEFIAPSEYMLRPPQPAVYLFVLDVSHNAVETGYLDTVCQSLLDSLSLLPGDTRTKIGFITFDSRVHFYNLQEGLSQPQMLVVSDIEDIFIPTPDSLLVNLNECKELVQDLLKGLPQMFTSTLETQCALGPALLAAFKLLSPTGGRVSVFQTQLPSVGVGALKSREDPNQRASAKDIPHLTPATDFYKKLALDCSGQQIAVDLFLLSGQYCDLASLACISKYSAGGVHYYPSYHHLHNPAQVEQLQRDLKRYFSRKIGFESVMRVRCTKGLSIHTFHGNFFVRSTDLLSLPNINPDSGFAVQMSIEENLLDMPVVSFQAALLYTSSKGERRIRVHTLCLPVVNSMADIFAGADVQAITGLLASMAVDRSVTASLSDARDALVNAAIDTLRAYRSGGLSVQQPGLVAPACLRLLPLYVVALLKQKAFRTGMSTRLDERVFAMCQLKYQPLAYLMLMIHPALYRVDNLTDEGAISITDRTIPQPATLQLSVEKLSRDGSFLMDSGSVLYLWVGRNCAPNFITQVLGVPDYTAIPQTMTRLPELDTAESTRTRAFISWLREQRPFYPILHVIREESPLKASFMQHMVEDRTESALSYYEFLLHLQQQVNK
ncbi:protein transport protein Sec24A-like isoform X2 [Polyodon spathula]|uniref:protein transport protein Sec24A-like isoform X2 n=1 Tax=Polyodon spathula TaxID=7913 RepID=UPI001B7EBA1E|nr:protein transport protein Sec24A-like isoform X2 [Polyodon spathula]